MPRKKAPKKRTGGGFKRMKTKRKVRVTAKVSKRTGKITVQLPKRYFKKCVC